MKPKYNTVRFRNLFSGATSAIVVCFGASVSQGATNLWTGATDSQWNTAGNWSLGHIPEKAVLDEDAVINTSTGNLATIVGANLLKTPKDIVIGSAGTGILNHISGDALTGGGNWLKVGLTGGTGTYNLANTTTAGAGISGFAQGSGNMVVSGEIQIAQGSGSTGTLNMNTSGLLSSGGAFFVGFVGITSGSGLLNMESGTLNVGGNFNVSDGGIINVGNSWSTTTTGTMNMTGGTVSSNGEFRVGNARGKGILNFSAGTLNTKNWTSIGRSGGHGAVNMSGGTWTKSGGGDFTVGDGYQGAAKGEFNVSGNSVITSNNLFYVGNNGSTAAMSVAGTASVTTSDQFFVGNGGGTSGTLNISDSGSITNNNWIVIGRQGGNGSVTMSGGTWKKNATDSNFIIGSNTGSVGLLTMTGGTVTVPDNGPIDRGMTWLGENDNSQGTLTMSGTAQFNTERFVLGNSGTAIGTMNLNGGNIATAHILGGTATANVHFNGTQITATAGSNDFIQNLDVADIQTGGLLIDSNNFTLTVPQLLAGTGGIVKGGLGTLTLTGANTNAGPTLINDGKLVTTTASDATGAITLGDYTAFGVNQTVINDVYNTSAVTFGTAGDTTLSFDLGAFAGNTTAAPLNVTGAAGSLALNGSVTVNIADTNIVVGSIPLVSYVGSKGGSGAFTLGTLPDGVVATLDDNLTGLVSLNVTRANDPYWTGTTNALWNTTDANWKNEFGGLATNYADGDPALFDDRVLTGPTAVVLNGTVTPGGSGVTFNNTTYNYSLTGTGKITGATGLLKLGTGSLDITTANDYDGATTITAGTINVATLANSGLASPISKDNLVLNGGTLNYTGATTTIDRGFTVGATNGGISTANNLTMSGPVFASGGALIKLGAGNLTLTNDLVSLGVSGQVAKVNNGTLSLVEAVAGNQYVSVPGELWVGSTTTAPGNLVVQDSTLAVGSWFTVGRGNGNTGIVSSFTANNSVISTGNISTGFNGDLATNNSVQNITLNNTVWTNNARTLFAESQNATTNLTLSGASSFTGGVGANSQVQLALNATNSVCNVIIEGTSSMTGTNNWFSIGDRGTATVTVRDSGSLNVGTPTSTIDFNISDNGPANGTLKIQNNATVTATGLVFVGKNSGTTGTVTMDGGTFTTNTYISIARRTGSTGVFNMNGGTVNQTDPGAGFNVGENGTGTLNMNGGAINVGGGGLYLTAETVGTGVAVANLNGGTITAKRVVERDFTLTNQSTLNFNGGLLKAATGAALNFIGNLDAANVKSGGANIDTNGETIAINQPLLDGTGGGGLTKSGAGFLQLNSANTYTGTTSVTAGSLGGTGSVAGALSVSATGTLAPGVAVGTFTAGASTISGTYACDVSGSTADKLVANGTLDVSAANLVINEVTPASGVPLVIATYTGATPAPFASVTGLPTGYSVVYNYGGNQIALVGPATPFSTWAQSNITNINPSADASAGGDPDGDGNTNIVEFALNGDPLSGASSGKVVGKVASVGGNPTLVLTLPVRTGASFSGATEQVSAVVDGVIYKIQGSDELATWNLVVSEVTGTDKTTIESTMPPQGSTDWTYRTFQSPGTVTGDPADFLRAVIVNP